MKVEFKYPAKIIIKDKLTGFTGIVGGRVVMMNGCIHYHTQPQVSIDKDTGKASSYVPDAQSFDEANVEVVDNLGIEVKPETVDFKFEVGDRVEYRISDFVGIITEMVVDANGCRRLQVQAPKLDKDGKKHFLYGFEQEFDLKDRGLNKKKETKVERSTTGCAIKGAW